MFSIVVYPPVVPPCQGEVRGVMQDVGLHMTQTLPNLIQ
jgi:hypothetical protein